MNFDFNFKNPISFFIRARLNATKDDVLFDTVEMPEMKNKALACYLLPKMEELTDLECAERFYGELCSGYMSITDLPAQYYMPVYHAIMQACDEIDSLTPYKDALNTALRADKRFQAA